MTFRSEGRRRATELPFIVFAVAMIVFTVVVVVFVVVVVVVEVFLDGIKSNVLTVNFLLKFKDRRNKKL